MKVAAAQLGIAEALCRLRPAEACRVPVVGVVVAAIARRLRPRVGRNVVDLDAQGVAAR